MNEITIEYVPVKIKCGFTKIYSPIHEKQMSQITQLTIPYKKYH